LPFVLLHLLLKLGSLVAYELMSLRLVVAALSLAAPEVVAPLTNDAFWGALDYAQRAQD
jgi:hypothetical protein